LPGLTIDTADCAVEFIADYGVVVTFSTRAGITFQGIYSWSEYSSMLIGSIINGTKDGNTNLPTEINNIETKEYIVHPNPFTDYISIDSGEVQINLAEIYDSQGSLIRKTNDFKQRLFLGDLKSGIYILRITDNSKKVTEIKIIKQ
jgi:hypothetical protein